MPATNKAPTMSIRIRWEGSFFSNHSLSLVNREVVSRLAGMPALDVAIHSGEAATEFDWDQGSVATLRALEGKDATPSVVVRHRWPLDPHPPEAGQWVIMQPWEFGALPRPWYAPMRFGADEVWVYSSFNRECYIEAGIPEEKIHVVPLGVHPTILQEPGVFPLRTRKRFRFLFVGGTITRKGIDILLEAYRLNFTPADDVCLVIKDFGSGSVYRGQTHDRLIRELQANPAMPEIEYIQDELTPEQLRNLYHACDCLVHPYRGEGFGLPIAEAMACGLPVIVPDQGGASDFCTAETALLVPGRRVSIPTEHGLQTRGTPWWVEVRARDVAERMREAFQASAHAAEVARRGRALVRERFTWQRAAGQAGDLIRTLSGASPSALRYDPERQHALHVQAGADCWVRGETVGAIQHFARAREHLLSGDATFNLAAALAHSNDFHTADVLLQTLVADVSAEELEPDQRQLWAEAWNLRAACRIALGDLAGANEALQQLLAVMPEHPQVREALAAIDADAQPRRSSEIPLIRWHAPTFNATGHADESRSFVLGLLDAGGWRVRLENQDPVVDRGLLGADEFQRLVALSRAPAGDYALDFQHGPAHGLTRPCAPLSVARTMFETDRIPDLWVEHCNRFSEVWVPSEFNRETFARAGVVREKLRVVPGCIDARKFDRSLYPRLQLPHEGTFRFASVFDLTPRKGWELLLRAFVEEFSTAEPVSLMLKPTETFQDSCSARERVQAVLDRLGSRRGRPRVSIIDETFSEHEMFRMYCSCDAFVLSSRGEGWGRRYLEAMAFGLPTIGTRWSGNLEFMNDDNSYLIDVDGLEPCELTWPDMHLYRGHRWARPSLSSLRALMRQVFEARGGARERGARARSEVLTRYDRSAVARQISTHFRELLLVPAGDAVVAARVEG